MGESKSVVQTQRRKKLQAVKYLGGRCQLCGYDRCQAALVFHHIEREDKEHKVTYIVSRWSWDRVRPELDKCILVCSNCHAEIHFGMVEPDNLRRIALVVIKRVCPICRVEYASTSAGQKYCSYACSYFGQRKVLRPTKSQLAKDINSMNWLAMGRKYGVSAQAVKKWAKRYALIE